MISEFHLDNNGFVKVPKKQESFDEVTTSIFADYNDKLLLLKITSSNGNYIQTELKKENVIAMIKYLTFLLETNAVYE